MPSPSTHSVSFYLTTYNFREDYICGKDTLKELIVAIHCEFILLCKAAPNKVFVG